MKLASICILNANKKQRTAGIHWKAPSATAKEQPINTGVAAAAKVLGRAANIHAFIEFVCTFSIIVSLKCFAKIALQPDYRKVLAPKMLPMLVTLRALISSPSIR